METTTPTEQNESKTKTCKKPYNTGNPACCGGAFYGLGIIGAAIFFFPQATGFWLGVLAFLKAIVWPVFFVLEGFKHFMMP
jgi:hypothetical protein